VGGSAERSLPMVCLFAIGKAFGLAAATRRAQGSSTGMVEAQNLASLRVPSVV
jgi:hypothetical protein